MKNALKNFWKDYKECCELSGRFYKNHWLGTIIVSVVCFLVSFGTMFAIDYCNMRKIEKKQNEEKEDLFSKDFED